MIALYVYAALALIPFVVFAPTAVHCASPDWLERELERRIADEVEDDAAANDNDWRPA